MFRHLVEIQKMPFISNKRKESKEKKFIMYSIYAWGIPFILNVAYAIMDAPGIPKNLIRPEMCKTKNFWLGDDALVIYHYIPVGAAVIGNICFFIVTIRTILYHDRQIAKQLTDSEINHYHKNKRKFCIYLKLFIVMGISWVLEIILWPIQDVVPSSIWNIADIIETLRGAIIFFAYVWKKKIMRLLLKRFCCQNRDRGKGSKSYDCPNTASNTISVISETVPMQNINLSNQ